MQTVLPNPIFSCVQQLRFLFNRAKGLEKLGQFCTVAAATRTKEYFAGSGALEEGS